MIYYIADTHFRDQAIFDKCIRPFKSLDEMEKVIIENWNNRVQDDDTVYVLGDIAKDDDVVAVEIFKRLKGHKHLIVGNHDIIVLEKLSKLNIFDSIKYIDLIKDGTDKVCICHYPLMDWIEFNGDGILVYGHIHKKTMKNGAAYGEIKKYYSDKLAYNCGVDVIGFMPRTLIELKEF